MGPLNHSPADIIRRALIQLGLGADPPALPWPVYSPTMPNTPDNCIIVSNTPGVDGGRDSVALLRSEQHGVQVMVRGTTDPVGWKKTRDIALAFDDGRLVSLTVTIDTSTYLVRDVVRVGDVIPLGKEATSSRFRFTLNGLVTLWMV